MSQCSRCRRERETFHGWCKECRKSYDAERFQRTKPERYAQVKARRQSMVEWARGLKEGPCVDCDHFFHPISMQWDHVGSDKVECVSVMVAQGLSRKRILAEIVKCELVCANCHAVRTLDRQRVV